MHGYDDSARGLQTAKYAKHANGRILGSPRVESLSRVWRVSRFRARAPPAQHNAEPLGQGEPPPHCRRLLWVGPRRTQASLRRGVAALGSEVVQGVRFVCSDMWKPYLRVIAAQMGQALHVLDRFHINGHLNDAVDQVRRAECRRLHGRPQAAQLKRMRWKLLRRGSRVRGHAKRKLWGLLGTKLATARAWMLKETFDHFWRYRSLTWAATFLDVWCERALRSRLEPLRKVARMLRSHEELILNWFRAKGEISNGPVEGLNNKIRVVTRRSYGFRTYHAMETALYHNLGRLPEPPLTHRFC